MTVGEIAKVCGGRLECVEENKMVTNISIDSRECNSNSLFIAVNDEVIDNNCYIEAAAANGATVMCEENDIVKKSIIIRDSERAFRKLAEYCRDKNGGRVVAVTGSVGKTTVKELCVSVIKQREGVLINHTEGNKNNLVGLPLTLLKTEKFDVTVLEAGISEQGEMAILSELSKPDIAVITNVGRMHSEQLGSKADIAREKLKITEHMPKNSTLLIPSSAEFPKNELPSWIEIMTVGEDKSADVQVKNTAPINGGVSFDVSFGGKKYRELYIPMYGRHAAVNGAFALAAASMLGADESEIRQGLAAYAPCGDRQRIIKSGAVTVISDCYNAGPESVGAALDAFEQIARENSSKAARRILLFGDMLELSEPEKEHFEIGKRIAGVRFDTLIAFGNYAKYYIEGAFSAGFPKNEAYFFSADESEKLSEMLSKLKDSSMVILIKGSRGMKLERFVSGLLEK